MNEVGLSSDPVVKYSGSHQSQIKEDPRNIYELEGAQLGLSRMGIKGISAKKSH